MDEGNGLFKADNGLGFATGSRDSREKVFREFPGKGKNSREFPEILIYALYGYFGVPGSGDPVGLPE